MFCNNCGKQVDDSAKFCTNCGNKLYGTVLEVSVIEKKIIMNLKKSRIILKADY